MVELGQTKRISNTWIDAIHGASHLQKLDLRPAIQRAVDDDP